MFTRQKAQSQQATTDAAAAVLANATAPGWDVRLMRLFIVGALVMSAILTLRHLLNVEIFDKNKLEIGLLLGWLIAKSGTVIDWLFGGSESGGRRADLTAHQAATAPPLGSQQMTAPKDSKMTGEVTTPAPEEHAQEAEERP